MGLGGRLLNSFPLVLFSFEVVLSFSWGVINGAKCFHPNFWARLLAIVYFLNICENLAEKPHGAIKVLNVDFWPLELIPLKVIDFYRVSDSSWVNLDIFIFLKSCHQWQEITNTQVVPGLVEKIVSLAHPHCQHPECGERSKAKHAGNLYYSEGEKAID